MNDEPVISSARNISPGELSIGQFITILNPTVIEKLVSIGGLFGGVTTEKVRNEDRSFMGDPLEVKAVCLPYVVVAILPSGSPLKFDTRNTQFMEISKEYVDALTSKAKGGKV